MLALALAGRERDGGGGMSWRMAARPGMGGGASPDADAGETGTEFTPGVESSEGARLAERRGLVGGVGGGRRKGLAGTMGFKFAGVGGFEGLGGIGGGDRDGLLLRGEDCSFCEGACGSLGRGGFRLRGEREGMGARESRRVDMISPWSLLRSLPSLRSSV